MKISPFKFQIFLMIETRFLLIKEIEHAEIFQTEGYFGIGFTQNKENNVIYKLKSEGIITSNVFKMINVY